MSLDSTLPQIKLPTIPVIQYGPFRMLEAVPWLMLASALRLVSAVNRGLAIPCLVLASVSLFLAFLLAARRMIEFADGSTQLGKLNFRQQLRLAGRVLWRVGLLLLGLAILAGLLGPRGLSAQILLGFDGIAFNQFNMIGMAWSGIVAATVLLMVVTAGDARKTTLFGALKELLRRAAWMIPAILAVLVFQIALSFGQSLVTNLIRIYWQTSTHPENIKNLVFFAYMFGFATLRLWGTLAILTLALRESYRRESA